MFFIRKDQKLVKSMKRRLKSSRAAVFAEFSFLAPVLVLFLSAMIELAAFWDSKVMATHTAWQIGRIASVRVHEDQKNLSQIHGMTFGEKYSDGIITNRTVEAYGGQYKIITDYLGATKKMKTFGDVTALFLMSTCGIGAFGSEYNEKVAGESKRLLVEQAGMLGDELIAKLKQLIHEKLNVDPSSEESGGWFDVLKKLVAKLIDAVIDTILKPILDFISGIVAKLTQWIFGIDANAFDENTWKHFAKRLSAAAVRANRPEFKVECTIEDASKMAHGDGRVWSSGWGKKPPNSFTYPQSASLNDERDRGWIKQPNVWPIQGMKQSLVDVKVEWPYSGSWIFPIVSTMGEKGNVVVTRGYSRVYTQPAIENEFLLSRGATKYQQGVVRKKYDFADLDIGAFVRMMSFSMEYRMRNEEVKKGKFNWGGAGWFYEPFWRDMGSGDSGRRDWRRTCRQLISGYHCKSNYDKYKEDTSIGSKRLTHYTGDLPNWFKKKYWAYREYFFWFDSTTLRLRYAGPNRCKDHMRCWHEGGDDWGFNGSSDQMFFNNLPSLALQEFNPDAGVHAQFECAVMAYDQVAPEFAALEGVGSVVAHDVGDKTAFDDLFDKTFRINVRSAFYCYNDRALAEGLIKTNLAMRTGAKGPNMKSTLRLQAWDFSMGQHERMALLQKKAKGNSEEVIDDLVDQSGIDVINSDSEDIINNFKEWWKNQQQKIYQSYNNINAKIPVLKTQCTHYPQNVSDFCNSMTASVFSDLKNDLKNAYEAIKGRESPPTTKEALIDAVHQHLASSGSYDAHSSAFNDAYKNFYNAYEKFRLDIVESVTNEAAFAAAIGVTSPHGSKPLDPGDIIGPDDPGDLPKPPGGDPTISGNDPYPFGDEWRLTDHGWERKK